MQPTTKSFIVGAFVAALIAMAVHAENGHQEDLRQMREPYVPTMYGSSDTNN